MSATESVKFSFMQVLLQQKLRHLGNRLKVSLISYTKTNIMIFLSVFT